MNILDLLGTGYRSALIFLLFIFFLLQCFGSSAQSKTVVEGDTIIATNKTLVVAENDTLIITGTLELKNDAVLTIKTNAVCIIYGNLIVKNKVNLSIGAHLIVGGNLDAPSGSGKVDVEVAPSAAFYILGTVSDNSDDFNCGNTSSYDPPGDTNCNYGDIISLEDNENDSTGIYDLFVSGDGNKGVTPVYSELCQGDAAVISALYQEVGTTYQWCDSSGVNISGETGYTFTTDQPGEYFVKITNGGETFDSHRAKVVVGSLPSIYSAWNNDGGIICLGGTANIGASATHNINWYVGNCSSGVLVGTGSQLSVGPDTTTTYFARAYNPLTGCESANCMSVTVTVKQPPTITLGVMPEIETEIGTASIPYSSTTGNPTNYTIDFDASAEAAGFSDQIDYALTAHSLAVYIPNGGEGIATGTYNGVLAVKIFTPVECESIAYPVSITIAEANTIASVSITVSNTTICQGEEVTFTATPLNGGSSPSFQWQIDSENVSGVNSATFVISSLNNAQEISCVMTSNLSGVSNNPATSNTITMIVNPLPATGEIIPD
ncbi:immunoglobulin domain-containing protein [Draconibacterium halophilum]|uniref:Ig-like domain-containing protein n=1 Tax=Draconibacterium halophilum TaxID=2706887 RepID=A0A6C0R8J3_9BACT|nr:hypothetical protein [Draconibacterium halophilum]QIA06377.1 hypothetical protein G0Q07_00910 [Draconibacterium halophilum]